MLIGQEIGNRAVQITALRGMAELSLRSGHSDESVSSYQAALSLARQIADPFEEARILEGMTETALALRDHHGARIKLRQALDIFEHLGAAEAESVRLQLEAIQAGARSDGSSVDQDDPEHRLRWPVMQQGARLPAGLEPLDR
jgi:hypothetical protein